MCGWMQRRIGGYRDQPMTIPMDTGMVDGWKNGCTHLKVGRPGEPIHSFTNTNCI